MPTIIEALLVATIGLVPGAAFVAALDSQVGQGRSALPDRLTRYLTVLDALHAALAPVTFILWHTFTNLELTQLSPWAWFVGRLATRLRSAHGFAGYRAVVVGLEPHPELG